MLIGILIGAVLMYVLMYVIGLYIKSKAASLTSTAVYKNMPYGELIITEHLTIEEVFYCLLDMIQKNRRAGKLYFVSLVRYESENKPV